MMETAQTQIESEGYRWLSGEYRNNKSKLTLLCPKGHRWSVMYSSFQQGHRCFTCSYNIRAGKTRKKLQEVIVAFEQEGYRVLTEKYKNNRQRLKIRCPKGHITNTMTWNNFKTGHRCSVCAKKATHTFEEIKKNIESEGYSLISTKYSGTHSKDLVVICPNEHQYLTRWNDFQQGYRCPKCAHKNRSAPRLKLKDIRQKIRQEGYTLLSTKYVGYNTKMSFQCSEGHKYHTTWTIWEQGARCPECAGNKKKRYQEVREKIEEQGHILLSKKYKNCKTKLRIRCPKGDVFRMSYNDFQQGHRCPNHRESRGEKLLKTILGRIYPEHTIKSQDSLGFLGRLRVDYSIPKLKLAFEYDGLHHFQPVQFGGISAEKANLAFKRQRKNDQKKQKMCEENGYRLIRLGYSESLTVEHIKDKIIKAGA